MIISRFAGRAAQRAVLARTASPLLTTTRSYHLLPSQALSLLSAHIPTIPPPIIAKHPSDVDHLLSHPTSGLKIEANVQDDSPQNAKLVDGGMGEASVDGLKGTRHHVTGKRMAQQVAEKLLSSSSSSSSASSSAAFESILPPYSHKHFDTLLLTPTPTAAASSQKSVPRFQILLVADRKPHKHPSRAGLHFGPTLTLSALPPSIPIAVARKSFPELTSVTCVDVGSIPPMSALEAEDKADAKEKLEHVARTAAGEAVGKLEQELDLETGSLDAPAKQLLEKTLSELFVLFWKSDGERFVLDVQLDPSAEKVHVQSQSLTFDDYTTGKAGRQKLLTALRQDGDLLYEKPMEVPPSQSGANKLTSAVNHDLSALEAEAESEGLIYRSHQGGNIALFGYGAGMGMGTLDGVIAAGGRPSNFFDGGGGATRENAHAAMRVMSKDPTVKCLLVNIFGGITRSDLVALGIVDAFEEYGLQHMPIVARFKGNKAEEAQKTLSESKLKVKLVGSLREGAREAAKAAAEAQSKSAAASLTSTPASSGRRAFSTSARSSLPQRRGLTTSASGRATARSKQPFSFVTGYAFAGKPREPEQAQGEQSPDGGDASSALGQPAQIGFFSDTDIGKWRDELLQGGDAGEDALACADMGDLAAGRGEPDGDVLLAVADGVGGWVENGVDPSLFSQALMYNVTQRAAEFKACPDRMGFEDVDLTAKSVGGGANSEHPGSPLALLKHAYDAVQEEPRVVAGSATACVITLDSSKGVLRSANVGDSGFIILRHGPNSAGSSPGSSPSKEKETSHRLTSDTKLQPAYQPPSSRSAHRPQEGVFFASTPLQLGFNTPLQLAKLPASMVQEGSIANKPEDAALWECHLRDGDLVIMATDGVWDNVHNAEIVQLTRFIKEKHHASWVSEHDAAAPSKMSASRAEKENANDWLAEERSFVQVLAHNLVEYTRMCQFSQTKRSPFEREAERYGIHYPGGKVDDAVVVIALVVER